MANALYTLGKQGILDGTIDVDTDNIKAVLVDAADYSPNTATDNDLADITAGGRVATSANLTVSVSGGTVDASDFSFTTVTGDQSEYIVIYQDTGVAGTSRLIAIYDTFTSGMPVTPNGGDIDVTVNASGLFSI
ncbi:MAG TPA: hypothetical protein PKD15_00820 [Candidatus Saccharibacteria bacterium]|nr:hypothetical protein [Candidatus Saccharibacteria bacterium]